MFSKERARRRLFENQLKAKGEAMRITCTRFIFCPFTFIPATNVQKGKAHSAKAGYRLYFPTVSIYCYKTIDDRGKAPRPCSSDIFFMSHSSV